MLYTGMENLGGVLDRKDSRDYKAFYGLARVPDSVSSPKIPVYNQGNDPFCTAAAIAAGINYLTKKNDMFNIRFLYENTRKLNADTYKGIEGLAPRDGIKFAHKFGIPRAIVPQNDSGFMFADASLRRVTKYTSLDISDDSTISLLRVSLSMGHPVVAVTNVAAWMGSRSLWDKIIPDKDSRGWHTILITGYAGNLFLFQNSWGETWGKRGMGKMTISFILNNIKVLWALEADI